MGFKISPAVGLVMSELILDGHGKTVDISSFSPSRFHGRQANQGRVRIQRRLIVAPGVSAGCRKGILPLARTNRRSYRKKEQHMAKKKGILERLKEGPVLGDGGYLLELEKRGWVRAGPFTPEVALIYPNALRELHIEFREAGADVLQALTFYASRDKLATVGLENRLEDLNRAAVRIAREVAGDKCLVAGNLSLTWMYEPNSPSAADRFAKHLTSNSRCRWKRAWTSSSAKLFPCSVKL